jgi:hypothetical protein
MKLFCLGTPHWRSLVVTLLLWCATQGALALNAGQRLEAIKQSLIDLSLGSEVNLASSAYLDERGVLHESSLLTSQSQVRGVRVLSYLEEAGLSTAEVEAKFSVRACPVARPGLRREARISFVQGSHDPRFGDHYLSELSRFSEKRLRQALASSAQWSVTPRQQFHNGYHHKMAASGGNQPPFEIQLRLQQSQPEFAKNIDGVQRYLSAQGDSALRWSRAQIPALAARASWDKHVLAFEIRLFDPRRGNTIAIETGELEYPPVPRGYSKTQLPNHFIEQLTDAVQSFIVQMDQALECSPHYYHVINSSPAQSDEDAGSGFRINAGSIAGVQVGDHFILSPTPQITGGGASLDDIETLVLTEVQAVDSHAATLVVTAGGDNSGSSRHNFKQYVAIYF